MEDSFTKAATVNSISNANPIKINLDLIIMATSSPAHNEKDVFAHKIPHKNWNTPAS
jgi:hypothetical protein